ncbi:ATP-binding protein [Phenylobacterium sp.]|jgi:hypothetical protein|uniref:ATP-binding protein n=1 Tax=Phenylobacterium sp. TaxID=1871053 RepID=UPI002F92514B
MTEYVATSIARRLIARMHATHERRRISVFAGPPGIGKTTAIEEFAKRIEGQALIVKIGRRNARELLFLQHTLEALRIVTNASSGNVPSSIWQLRTEIYETLCAWARLDPQSARRGWYAATAFPHLTIVLDEAQNLSREAIEGLRYWNDSDRCYAPFPLGLVFVGNNEFSLASTSKESVISAAVADRALYIQTYDYDDVTDDDLRLFIEARVEIEDAALTLLLRTFKGPRAIRSLRRVSDHIDELAEVSAGRAITPADVRAHLDRAAAS